jgi:rod shape-determining protein MreD
MSPESPLLPQGAELRKPPTRTRVYLSLALALAVTLLPWDHDWRWLLPDFTLLLLLYWNIHAPRQAGLGAAFVLGLVTDVAQGLLLGLNALAYCAATFAVLLVRRRLANFAPLLQTPQIAPVLVGKEALVLALGMMIGRGEADWRWLAAGLLGAALWWPLSWAMERLGAHAAPPVPERRA